ncbi:hypothetical protein TNCV_1913631 [Trichonephila clavipes]|nr:hypothetical protein TNCV_1913631 [Trichonephila clavipes]
MPLVVLVGWGGRACRSSEPLSLFMTFQAQQRSLNNSLGDTVGSPLVHLGDLSLNGSTSIRPNASPQPSLTCVIYGRGASH